MAEQTFDQVIPEKTVYSQGGMAATSHPLATKAAVESLRAGGNAADAAVTAAAVLSVVEPHMTGIGGDMFSLVWSQKDKKLYGLNAGGPAGSSLSRNTLLERGLTEMPSEGPETVTVPGALAGWDAMLQRFGRRSLGDALEEAAKIAGEGFHVTHYSAREWAGTVEKLKKYPPSAEIFLNSRGEAPREGDLFSNGEYARTLRHIQKEGTGYLYSGALGKSIVDYTTKAGGFLREKDLADYTPLWVEPIYADYRGYRVYEIPPQTQGIAALEMLKILEAFPVSSLGQNSPELIHLVTEAKKLAFADLFRYVGDPGSMNVDPRDILSSGFISERRRMIDWEKAAARVPPGGPFPESETVYFCTADAEGNMVSFINSIFSWFGSGIVAPGTGFALQNRGAGFTLEPGLPNTAGPGKKPLHTIIPSFVTRSDGSPWMAFGVKGATMQPQGQVQVLINLIDFGMDLQDALSAPRFRQSEEVELGLEEKIPDAVRESLTRKGHSLYPREGVPFEFGGAQAIMRTEKGWAGASDPRKDGYAGGH